MTSIEGRVKEFVETWEKRRSGELPMPDSTIICSKCGVQVMGDQRVEFINGGIVCIPCFGKKASMRHAQNHSKRCHTKPHSTRKGVTLPVKGFGG